MKTKSKSQIEAIIGEVVQNRIDDIMYNFSNGLSELRFQFIQNIKPVFVQKFVRSIRNQFIAMQQIAEFHVKPILKTKN